MFDALSEDARNVFPEGDLVAGGCEHACADATDKLCGCTDDGCTGAKTPGQEHHRRWAVYKTAERAEQPPPPPPPPGTRPPPREAGAGGAEAGDGAAAAAAAADDAWTFERESTAEAALFGGVPAAVPRHLGFPERAA